MNAKQPHILLVQALHLSRKILDAAENADAATLTMLDDERAQLIKSFRLETLALRDADRALLNEIVELNNRALGLMEHHRRGKGRELDMAAVGRRAVAAYGQVTQQR